MAPAHSRLALSQTDEEKSADLLQNAQNKALKSEGYNSTVTREKLTTEFVQCTNGMLPYQWQINVAEAILLGLDCMVIAGTGAGKTMSFVMPLFVKPQKIVIIVSPLNVLEEDQVPVDFSYYNS
jgi:ATP-dependent helicase YprA (DUF1998 family)